MVIKKKSGTDKIQIYNSDKYNKYNDINDYTYIYIADGKSTFLMSTNYYIIGYLFTIITIINYNVQQILT